MEDEKTREKWKKSHGLPNTPREMLSSEQEWRRFIWLRNDSNVRDKHNEMARERQEGR